MRIVVTGATGFLGGHLVEALLSRGDEVVVWARASSDTRALEAHTRVSIRRGSFSDHGLLTDAMRGADAVVHAAGGGKVLRTEDLYRDNEGSAIAVRDAALAAGSTRIVLVSSLAAAGGSPPGRARRESDPPSPASHYGKSKLAAERALLDVRNSIEVVIVRPPAVYGPGDTRMIGLFEAAARGIIPMVAPSGTLSLVYGPDCADALSRACRAPVASGSVYFVADGAPYVRRDFARHIADAVGARARVLPIPIPALVAAGAVNEALGRLRGRSVVLSRDKAADIRVPHQTCDAKLAREELGFAPTLRFDEGARVTAKAYRDAGWL